MFPLDALEALLSDGALDLELVRTVEVFCSFRS